MLTAKPKRCDGACGELRPIWKNHQGKRYCRNCWNAVRAESTPAPVRTPARQAIRQVSDKQERLNRAYTEMRKLFFSRSEHRFCKARLSGCTTEATDVHHKRGRGRWLLALETWLPVCRSCHQWIETHPEDAIALGLSLSRLEDNNLKDTL